MISFHAQLCGEIFQKPQLLEQHQATKHAVTQLLDGDTGKNIVHIIFKTGEFVKAKAARNSKRRDERCIADGNELLSVCGVIKSGFSPKMDGISTLSTSWRAHTAIPEEIEEEFKFMNVKRAMLVCRVVAGRVGCELDEDVDKQDGGADSVLGRGGSGVHTRLDEQELLVFNPRAVLPCFVIVYTV
ncbi:C2H2-LIKE ZINC FINGER PROTEIN [Salix purpurea]|uniref:C2H2-LIKE ZINC FINGER PROTEIN n=1 Tax=Salix purpurea TaxID=77065 RepID=A0A9Q0PP54_SALPP|nr:C2H2-LIKE ZINC FINGER PROTEIN [Salix purpurea]